MNTADVLNAAADDLEANGWRQGNPGMEVAGPHCLMGSIGAAVGESCHLHAKSGVYSFGLVGDSTAAQAVADYLGIQDVHRLWAWNDRYGRTSYEVVEVLRAAALIAAASEVDVTVVRPEARLP